MKLSILLAEDTSLNQRLIRKIVQKWGDELDIANDGQEAIDKLKIRHYDIILMDIQMPVKDGYSAAKHIRELGNTETKNIPIIALTAHATKEEAEKCLSIGMNAYISKPFDPKFLRETILQLTSRSMPPEQTELKNVVTENAGLYDLTYLIDHAEGDNTFLEEMIGIFLAETPKLLEELRENINEVNYLKIKVTSHSMKGLFLTLGINKAAIYLREIETLAEDGSSFDRIKENFEKISSIFNSCEAPLTNELHKIRSS
ncbi:MAG TPA: response regulator [Bacteroidia bacterium]